MHFPRVRLPWYCVLGVLLLAGAAWGAEPAETASGQAAAPARIEKPLVAHWSFDEQFGDVCRDGGPNGYDASPQGRHAPGMERVEGLFGTALSFSGSHMLRVRGAVQSAAGDDRNPKRQRGNES